jgi:hypothetical protein
MEPNLENIYASSVAHRGRINNLSFGSSMVQKERDPSLVNLENTVFAQMFELVKEEKPPQPVYKQNELKVVSYEEALKQLMELENALSSGEHSPTS